MDTAKLKEKSQQIFKTIRELRAKKVAAAVGGVGLLSYGYFATIYDRCPAEGALTETLATLAVSQLECEDIEKVTADVHSIVLPMDFCGRGDLPEAIIVDMPSGSWTAVAAGCTALLPKLEALIIEGKAPASWKCKKDEFDRSALEEACLKLE